MQLTTPATSQPQRIRWLEFVGRHGNLRQHRIAGRVDLVEQPALGQADADEYERERRSPTGRRVRRVWWPNAVGRRSR